MPRGSRSQAAAAPEQERRATRARAEFVQLEKRLVLVAWLNHLFGYSDNRDLLHDTNDKRVAEGFDAEGRSHMYHHLVARGDQVKVDRVTLAAYDDNLRCHVEAMNRRRPEPIQLRYFQYLAVLFTEVFLDRWLNHRASFLVDLKRFVDEHNAALPPGEDPYPHIAESDLDKLAYWMATGSGKTLIMHFNYRQFLHYYRRPLDNILLITPNEGMTEQHLEEMRLSDIPCERFQNAESGLGLASRDVVRVIEIHKLVEEKRGGGVSVPVEAFEGNNLIFVDEGHKGSGGETWRRYRDALGETGFTFEYSATFGQALTAARNEALTVEYGKAIVFNYSYPYFYQDGYGKDFRVLNLREDTSEDMTDTLLLGNLLSFYQQQRVFADDPAAEAVYNLEAPLWIFVGSSVKAVYREAGRQRSDVSTVARFLHRFLRNEDGWAVQGIRDLLSGQSGLENTYGEDVFGGRFRYLVQAGRDPQSLYADIVRSVFNADTSAGLHIAPIRGSEGELGLKANPAGDYFGVIYIGDTPAFRRLVEADEASITLDPEDAFTDSLFGSVNLPASPIKVLVGARKFIEGWSSWRVSNMGLLNIGRGEGSSIIQLFGRGVRLRGKGFGLKRSTALDGDHPEHLRLLETLEIFAVRAKFMAEFRDNLEREGVETEGSVELSLPIRRNDEFLGKGLLTLRLPAEKQSAFGEECTFVLAADEAAKVTVDLSLRVEEVSSSAAGLRTAVATAGETTRLDSTHLDLLDWQSIYLELLEYAEMKSYGNLFIPRTSLREVLEADPLLYELTAPEPVVAPGTFAELDQTRDAVLAILRAYVDKFYRVRRAEWEKENLRLQTLSATDPNLQEQEYTLRVPRSEQDLAREIERLIQDADAIYRDTGAGKLRNVYFDRHLYQPLLADPPIPVTIEPKGLEPGERRFVEDLRSYLEDHPETVARTKVFLLRNRQRGRGVGFFGRQGHYPDFILWVKSKQAQRIVFVEPHGMLMETAARVQDRADLLVWLKGLEQKLNHPDARRSVELDYFIVANQSLDELQRRPDMAGWSREDFAAAHILVPEQEYVPVLFGQS